MVSPPTSFDAQHEDIIHDAQFDYYGKRLATCSSDHTIKVFDVDADTHTLVDTLKAHTGPVWAVAWSHPKFGSLLASASYDGRVIIWRDQGNNVFGKVYEHTKHSASVNSIAWAPHEYGLVLAAGSSDGFVSLISYDEVAGKWDEDKSARFLAHTIGVTAVAWAPATSAGSLFGTAGNPDAPAATSSASELPAKQLATAGCDNLVKIWQLDGSPTSTEAPIASLSAHEDWVRDVAWAPNVGIPATYLASCGQDKAVYVWTRQHALAAWEKKKVGTFTEVVWRVSWSLAGDVLAVAAGDNKVTLWRENVEGEWEAVSTLTE
ncbi:protein transporter sec-13 [Catenaria anguillulae PL171]|uniref:Protein transporter sec-13 n=1 Tax=Catenaria anguillulae PL171 TaxID=765915 RepID=A0A1Y2H4C1_9FUNG|nr:protein transporter sec-13 [Catenaria anguillulae PL171]